MFFGLLGGRWQQGNDGVFVFLVFFLKEDGFEMQDVAEGFDGPRIGGKLGGVGRGDIIPELFRVENLVHMRCQFSQLVVQLLLLLFDALSAITELLDFLVKLFFVCVIESFGFEERFNMAESFVDDLFVGVYLVDGMLDGLVESLFLLENGVTDLVGEEGTEGFDGGGIASVPEGGDDTREKTVGGAVNEFEGVMRVLGKTSDPGET